MDARSSASIGGETKLSATRSSAMGAMPAAQKSSSETMMRFSPSAGTLGAKRLETMSILLSECSRIVDICSAVKSVIIGTAMAPVRTMPKYESPHSGLFSERSATLSPFFTPSSTRRAAIRRVFGSRS